MMISGILTLILCRVLCKISVKIIKEFLMTFGKEFEALVKNRENFNDLYS